MNNKKISDIVKLAQGGDKTATETLYHEYSKSTYFLALKLLENSQDAEDVTQEVFLYAFQKFGELQNPESFAAWLNRITTSKCTDFLRKKRPIVSLDDVETTDLEFEETDHSLIPDMKLDKEETARIIIEIVDKLPLPQRVCVYYYYYEQLSIKEIAANLAVPESTVASRLALARDKIRVELEKLEDEEGLKLYMASPLILVPILGMLSQNTEVPANLLANVLSQLNLSASAATVATAATTATTSTTATSATAATTVISTKTIIAAVVCCVVVTCGIVAGVFLLGGDDEPVIDVGGEVTDTVGGITTTPSETEPTTPEIPDEPEPPIEPLEIDLSQQGITDEILAAMVADGRIPQNVTSLDLWQNFITDVSPLAELTNLTHLYLSENQITDVSPLAELTNLQVLWLVDNQVHDVSPLGGLTRLTWLSLVRNQITDVSPLAELTRLERLTLLGNPLDSVQISQIRAALPNAELDIN